MYSVQCTLYRMYLFDLFPPENLWRINNIADTDTKGWIWTSSVMTTTNASSGESASFWSFQTMSIGNNNQGLLLAELAVWSTAPGLPSYEEKRGRWGGLAPPMKF